MDESTVAYIAAAAAIVLIVAVLLRAWLRRRPTAEQIEMRRRLTLNRVGKMGDGMVLDIRDTAIEYSYDVRGVGYTAVQDVSTLQGRLPAYRALVTGPALIKYDPRNPANSIVLCEDWSGLRNLTNMQVTGTQKE